MKEALKTVRTLVVNPAWVCFVWFGMVVGVSVIATIAKFSAPLLERVVALDVGRVTFAAFNKVELAALVVLLVLVRVSGRAGRYWAPCGALAAIVILQSAWLLPELSDRSLEIAAGREPPPTIAHAAYSVLEIGKLLILMYTGFFAMRGVRCRS